MEGFVFELEYTDRESGEIVCKEVAEFGIAQQLAKDLAKASGRRAVIRRKRATARHLWSVYAADLQTGEIITLWTELPKSEVLRRWKLWKERKMDCVLVAWPEWTAKLEMSLPGVAA